MWSSFSCQTVLTTWDCGHHLTCLEPSSPPLQALHAPSSLLCSPSQVKFQGQSHDGLPGGQQEKRGNGEATAVRGVKVVHVALLAW